MSTPPTCSVGERFTSAQAIQNHIENGNLKPPLGFKLAAAGPCDICGGYHAVEEPIPIEELNLPPPTDLYGAQSSCFQKKAYRSREQAYKEKHRREAEGAPPLRVYQCDRCSYWHLTNQVKPRF